MFAANGNSPDYSKLDQLSQSLQSNLEGVLRFIKNSWIVRKIGKVISWFVEKYQFYSLVGKTYVKLLKKKAIDKIREWKRNAMLGRLVKEVTKILKEKDEQLAREKEEYEKATQEEMERKMQEFEKTLREELKGENKGHGEGVRDGEQNEISDAERQLTELNARADRLTAVVRSAEAIGESPASAAQQTALQRNIKEAQVILKSFVTFYTLISVFAVMFTTVKAMIPALPKNPLQLLKLTP